MFSDYSPVSCSQQRVLAALVSEPGFQFSSLEFLLGVDGTTSVGAGAVDDQKSFSLANC